MMASDKKSGYGDGFGYGSGDGSGFGFGDGFGFGYGYGVGLGDWSGYGVGIEIGMIDDLPILWLHPWPYISVGCEVHHIDHWRDHWREIADKHEIDVKREIVDKLLREVGDDTE
jgi:hypothetical protein